MHCNTPALPVVDFVAPAVRTLLQQRLVELDATGEIASPPHRHTAAFKKRRVFLVPVV